MGLINVDDDQDGGMNIEIECKTCRRKKRKDCDGEGWLEPLGPYRDGSYISSRPCPNENPHYETH